MSSGTDSSFHICLMRPYSSARHVGAFLYMSANAPSWPGALPFAMAAKQISSSSSEGISDRRSWTEPGRSGRSVYFPFRDLNLWAPKRAKHCAFSLAVSILFFALLSNVHWSFHETMSRSMYQILSQTENIPLFHAYARKKQYGDFRSDSLSHDKHVSDHRPMSRSDRPRVVCPC